MTIDRQSVVDALLALLGGILGGAAVGAYTVHRYLHSGDGDKLYTHRYLSTPVNSAPQGATK